jgi:hypothetical protein
MSAFTQAAIVALIVTIAALYAVLKLMPAVWRRRLASLAARHAAEWGVSEANARRVEAKLSTGGACGSCDTCKACATPSRDTGMETEATAYRTIPIRRATTTR